jgi:cyclohexyl-isocyanide hydratase
MTRNTTPAALRIGFLLYPWVTQLDLTGPAQVLCFAQGAQLHFVAQDMQPVRSDCGLSLLPTDTFASCPQLDILCLPGGSGQMALMQNDAAMQWVAHQGAQAKWLASVCSGSLILGAAGLLKGYRAAAHWNYRDLLPHFGATPDAARVVQDRNRITGGGVTAGIDLALTLLALIEGEDKAKQVQLFLEYAPAPPFDAGRPELAGEPHISHVRAMFEAQIEEATERIGAAA